MMKKNDTTNMCVNLSWHESNESIMGLMEEFKISHYNFDYERCEHRPLLSQKESEKLIKFLTKQAISSRTCTSESTDEVFVYFKLKADLYIQPNHSIEIRA